MTGVEWSRLPNTSPLSYRAAANLERTSAKVVSAKLLVVRAGIISYKQWTVRFHSCRVELNVVVFTSDQYHIAIFQGRFNVIRREITADVFDTIAALVNFLLKLAIVILVA